MATNWRRRLEVEPTPGPTGPAVPVPLSTDDALSVAREVLEGWQPKPGQPGSDDDRLSGQEVPLPQRPSLPADRLVPPEVGGVQTKVAKGRDGTATTYQVPTKAALRIQGHNEDLLSRYLREEQRYQRAEKEADKQYREDVKDAEVALERARRHFLTPNERFARLPLTAARTVFGAAIDGARSKAEDGSAFFRAVGAPVRAAGWLGQEVKGRNLVVSPIDELKEDLRETAGFIGQRRYGLKPRSLFRQERVRREVGQEVAGLAQTARNLTEVETLGVLSFRLAFGDFGTRVRDGFFFTGEDVGRVAETGYGSKGPSQAVRDWLMGNVAPSQRVIIGALAGLPPEDYEPVAGVNGDSQSAEPVEADQAPAGETPGSRLPALSLEEIASGVESGRLHPTRAARLLVKTMIPSPDETTLAIEALADSHDRQQLAETKATDYERLQAVRLERHLEQAAAEQAVRRNLVSEALWRRSYGDNLGWMASHLAEIVANNPDNYQEMPEYHWLLQAAKSATDWTGRHESPEDKASGNVLNRWRTQESQPDELTGFNPMEACDTHARATIALAAVVPDIIGVVNDYLGLELLPGDVPDNGPSANSEIQKALKARWRSPGPRRDGNGKLIYYPGIPLQLTLDLLAPDPPRDFRAFVERRFEWVLTHDRSRALKSYFGSRRGVAKTADEPTFIGMLAENVILCNCMPHIDGLSDEKGLTAGVLSDTIRMIGDGYRKAAGKLTFRGTYGPAVAKLTEDLIADAQPAVAVKVLGEIVGVACDNNQFKQAQEPSESMVDFVGSAPVLDGLTEAAKVAFRDSRTGEKAKEPHTQTHLDGLKELDRLMVRLEQTVLGNFRKTEVFNPDDPALKVWETLFGLEPQGSGLYLGPKGTVYALGNEQTLRQAITNSPELSNCQVVGSLNRLPFDGSIKAGDPLIGLLPGLPEEVPTQQTTLVRMLETLLAECVRGFESPQDLTEVAQLGAVRLERLGVVGEDRSITDNTVVEIRQDAADANVYSQVAGRQEALTLGYRQAAIEVRKWAGQFARSLGLAEPGVAGIYRKEREARSALPITHVLVSRGAPSPVAGHLVPEDVQPVLDTLYETAKQARRNGHLNDQFYRGPLMQDLARIKASLQE